MGFLDWAKNTAEGAVNDVEHLGGEVADTGAHLIGDGLTAVGLSGAAQAVDKWGDQAADALGDAVAEKRLGETNDPTELVHGDVGALTATAQHLGNFAVAFGETAQGLSGLDTEHWSGPAAEAFRAKYAPHPQQWADAKQACFDAANALDSYAQTVKWAQGQAAQAIDLYAQGQQATQQAQAVYQRQVDVYNSDVNAYNALASRGLESGQAPPQPAAFTDPGAVLRQQAQDMLDRARTQRDSAAGQAQSAISAATNLAPAEPSFGQRLLDDGQDLLQGGATALQSFAGGVVKGAADIVGFARSLNPLDPYNMTHPAAFVDGVSSTAAGLLHASSHPMDLVKGLVGTGWGTNPAEALGKLVPNIALAVGTDGAGTAADAGASVAERAGMDAAESGARDAAGTAIDNARDPGQMVCKDDPIDVASGNMVLPQTDVDLPGVLPLVIERTHVSAYRLGWRFGRCWASTLDQRLEVDERGVLYTPADGVVLFYPHPGIDAPVLPEEGARWPLTHTQAGGYTITDPHTGRILHFATRMGGSWPITAITDRNQHRIAFHYDPSGTPTEIHHDGGYRIRITTDNERISALHLAGAGEDGADVELIRYGYHGGNLTQVINSSGQALRFTYDHAGRITEWVDRNDVWYRYTYDGDGRCVHVEGTDGALTGSFDYDPANRVTLHTDALGTVTRFEFDQRRHITAETDPLGNTTHSEFNRYGRLLTRTDPLGRTARNEYDAAGNLVRVTRPDGSQILLQYSERNLPTITVDPDGAVWRHDYDQAGNRISSTDPAGLRTHYAYDGHGHLTDITTALGNRIHVEANTAGLPVAVTDPTGAVTRYRRDGFGRVVEHTDPVGGTSRMGWTVEGKLAWRTDPTGATERWTYDGEGNPVEYIDALGHSTRTEYTHFDLPAARTGPDGARLEYRYDPELRLTSVTNPQGLVWRYAYDPAGNLTRESDFDGRVLTYAYDQAGQLTQRTNGVGQTISFTRDRLGQVVARRAGGEVTEFHYDAAGRLLRAANADAELAYRYDPVGRVLAETCNGRTVASGYDAVGHRVHRRTPSGVEATWTYDAAGNPTTVHTAGQRLRFTYDHAGREVERRLDSAFLLAQTWDANHQVTSQTLIGGELAAHPGQPAAAAGSAMHLLQRRAYTYRPDGNLVGMADHLSGARRFDLDLAGRVTAVHGPNWTENYTYDPAGNITHANWPNATTNETDTDTLGPRSYTGTLITHAGDIRYQHDAQGRVVLRQQKRLSTKDAMWRYTWAADDRLIGVITPDGTHWRYRYDPLGRRIAKQRLAPDQATVVEQIDFTWDGTTLAEQTHNATHITTWDYQPGSHRPISQIEHTIPLGPGQPSQEWIDQRFYAIVTDLIGTPTELVDPAGNLAWHHQPSLWGAALSRLANRAYTPLRFPGQYHDPETGLHYNYHRYYDPTTARYTSQDPLGLAPAPNPTTYVANPLSWADPLGLSPCNQTPEVSARTPIGASGRNLQVTVPDGVTARNAPMTIAGRDFSGHALDQMQSRGIMPSAVENTIQFGGEMVGKRSGTSAFYDPISNLTVITDTESGRVVTAVWGLVKQ